MIYCRNLEQEGNWFTYLRFVTLFFFCIFRGIERCFSLVWLGPVAKGTCNSPGSTRFVSPFSHPLLEEKRKRERCFKLWNTLGATSFLEIFWRRGMAQEVQDVITWVFKDWFSIYIADGWWYPCFAAKITFWTAILPYILFRSFPQLPQGDRQLPVQRPKELLGRWCLLHGFHNSCLIELWYLQSLRVELATYSLRNLFLLCWIVSK